MTNPPSHTSSLVPEGIASEPRHGKGSVGPGPIDADAPSGTRKPHASKRDLAAQRDLDKLYAELPRLDCKGLCSNSCGPVMMSRVEWQRITRTLGREPKGTADLTCPMLDCMGRCSVYALRPTLCRLWGLVESMPCVYGCKPERILTDAEGHEFLRRAAEVGA